jgi:hypothetical protein
MAGLVPAIQLLYARRDARHEPGMTLWGGQANEIRHLRPHRRRGVPLGQLYAERLTIAEAYDRAGFTAITSPSTTRRRSAPPPRRR